MACQQKWNAFKKINMWENNVSVYKIILFIVDMNGKYSVKCILFLKAHLHLVRKELHEEG